MTIQNQRLPGPVEGCLEVCRRCDRIADAAGAAATISGQPLYPAIGAHLRHCLDHFICLARGLESGTIDYDDRSRDPRLETEPATFRRALAEVVGSLEGLGSGNLDRTVEVLVMAAPGTPPTPMRSTLARELAFVSSHTVHHLAIIVETARAHGVDLPPEIAVAFSTAAYHETAAGDG